MEPKMSDSSLIDSSDLASPVPTAEAKAETAPKVRTRRKVKPYEQLKQVTQHTAARKAAKKGDVPVKKGKKISAAPAKKGKATKASSKASSNGSGAKTGICSICHKPLSRHTSVENGIGETCANKMKLLPKGFDNFAEHYASYVVVDDPSKTHIKLKDAIAIAKGKGVSQYSFLIAVGGNRMLRPPLDKVFQITVYRNTRYVLKAAVTDKSLNLIKNAK